MANDKKFVEQITPMDEDFARWYTDIVKKADLIDYSSVNIAKPFHIGHLLTTAIGGSLYRMYKYCGYNAVGINHLGDWGTQFGKLICAYKRWGVKEVIEKDPINELLKIYVNFVNHHHIPYQLAHQMLHHLSHQPILLMLLYLLLHNFLIPIPSTC